MQQEREGKTNAPHQQDTKKKEKKQHHQQQESRGMKRSFACTVKSQSALFRLLQASTTTTTNNTARLGLLTLKKKKKKEIPTPAYFLYTKRASPTVHVDRLKEIDGVQGLHFVCSDPAFRFGDEHVQGRNGISSLMNTEPFVLFSTLNDPLIVQTTGSNKNGAAITTQAGKRSLTASQFTDVQIRFETDMFACLSDAVPAFCSSQRAKKAVVRSVEWLKHTIARLKQYESGQVPRDDVPPLNVRPVRNNKKQKKEKEKEKQQPQKDGQDEKISEKKEALLDPVVDLPHCFASIEGGIHMDARVRCAEEMVNIGDEHVSGYVLGGMFTGESPSQRREIISALLGIIPRTKPILLPGVGRPLDVLDAVGCGVDMFEAAYPEALSKEGFASCFETDITQAAVPSGQDKMNLRDLKYREDDRALVANCTCYACKNHTRAYINHLFNVHELLGPSLLYTHNVHVYSLFFQRMRAAIQDGKFAAFTEFIKKQF